MRLTSSAVKILGTDGKRTIAGQWHNQDFWSRGKFKKVLEPRLSYKQCNVSKYIILGGQGFLRVGREPGLHIGHVPALLLVEEGEEKTYT